MKSSAGTRNSLPFSFAQGASQKRVAGSRFLTGSRGTAQGFNPTSLDAEQKKLFKQLARTMGTEVEPQERGFFDKLREFIEG